MRTGIVRLRVESVLRSLSSFIVVVLTIGAPLRFVPTAAAQEKQSVETVYLPGLRQRVENLIDHWGVPHIYPKNEADLFFAQGFNAPRDRLFQIDLWHRRGLGRLADVFGSAFIEQDKATRLYLYRGDMKQEWASSGIDAREISSGTANLTCGTACGWNFTIQESPVVSKKLHLLENIGSGL